MFVKQFEFEHKKFGTIEVQIDEEYNEIEKADEMKVWAIYFNEEKETHVGFNYLKENKKSEKEIRKELEKLMK